MEEGAGKFTLTRTMYGYDHSWEGIAKPTNDVYFSHIELSSGDRVLMFIHKDHIEQVLNFINTLEGK